jgi:hypothetical protein
LIRDAAAHWKRGAAEARIASSAVTFTEHVLPGSEFTVVGDGGGYSGPGLNTVDLRESRDARAMAVGHLRNATCWERGTCSQELFHRWFNANPFTATMVVAFVVGFVLAVPIVVLFRRHSVKIAVVLSVGGGIAGIVTIFQSKFQSWSYHLGPLFVVAVPAIAVGLLIGAIVLRMFFIHARRDPKAT